MNSNRKSYMVSNKYIAIYLSIQYSSTEVLQNDSGLASEWPTDSLLHKPAKGKANIVQ